MTAHVRGQRLLLAVVYRSRATEVAARLRVSSSNVTRWIAGDTMPSATHRACLQSLYGIPTDAWSQRA